MTTDGPFRKMLFAVDESDTSRLALPLVAAYARAWRAHLHLLHIHVSGPERTAARGSSGELVHNMVDALNGIGVAASGQVHVVRAEGDSVGAAIVGVARRSDAELVVVGSHGRVGMDALFTRAISHEVAADLKVPVLVVRVAPGQRARPIRVIVAIDSSSAAELALADAVRVARPTDAMVRVLHVEEPAGAHAELGLGSHEEAKRVVERGVATVQGSGLDADQEIVLAGDGAADAIGRATVRFDADLVVVASRRPSDLNAFFAGSVAYELINRLDRPVLLAHR